MTTIKTKASHKNTSATNASSTSATALVVVKPPPADANIPSVPEGTEPTNGTDYRGLLPKKTELAVLGDVVTELENSTEFTALFGRTMPSVAFIIQVLTAANQWSMMRNKTDAWDLYARTQEGLTWVNARALMTKMKPVFEATASANADVATQFPSLGILLGAAKVIAKRGVATRKGNAKSKAKGEAPTKGAVAKKVRDATKVVADHPTATAAATGGGETPVGTASDATSSQATPVAAGGAVAGSAPGGAAATNGAPPGSAVTSVVAHS
jgi:hypothetical protein